MEAVGQVEIAVMETAQLCLGQLFDAHEPEVMAR